MRQGRSVRGPRPPPLPGPAALAVCGISAAPGPGRVGPALPGPARPAPRAGPRTSERLWLPASQGRLRLTQQWPVGPDDALPACRGRVPPGRPRRHSALPPPRRVGCRVGRPPPMRPAHCWADAGVWRVEAAALAAGVSRGAANRAREAAVQTGEQAESALVKEGMSSHGGSRSGSGSGACASSAMTSCGLLCRCLLSAIW